MFRIEIKSGYMPHKVVLTDSDVDVRYYLDSLYELREARMIITEGNFDVFEEVALMLKLHKSLDVYKAGSLTDITDNS